jgi:hypothetical protein
MWDIGTPHQIIMIVFRQVHDLCLDILLQLYLTTTVLAHITTQPLSKLGWIMA